MQPILECCCGIDVHKDMIEACIISGINSPEIIQKRFSTIPSELKEFTVWLYENNCYHVAMESTGVYWRPVYEAIEEYSVYARVSPTDKVRIVSAWQKKGNIVAMTGEANVYVDTNAVSVALSQEDAGILDGFSFTATDDTNIAGVNGTESKLCAIS